MAANERESGVYGGIRLILKPADINTFMQELKLRVSPKSISLLTSSLEYIIKYLLRRCLDVTATELSQLRAGKLGEEQRKVISLRQIQYTIRTDNELWTIFNSSFGTQVLLAHYLDVPTEALFKSMELPLHNRKELCTHPYYQAVISSIPPIPNQKLIAKESNSTSPTEGRRRKQLTNFAQIMTIVAAIHPFYSLSSECPGMIEALLGDVMSTFCSRLHSVIPSGALKVAFSEGRIMISDAAVKTQLFGFLPAVLADGAAKLHEDALLPTTLMSEGDYDKGRVKMCVKHQRDIVTLAHKYITPRWGVRIATMFEKICIIMHLDPRTTVLIYNGKLLDGRKKLVDVWQEESLDMFAVPLAWWTYKRRNEARRGVINNHINHAKDLNRIRTHAVPRVNSVRRQEPGIPMRKQPNSRHIYGREDSSETITRRRSQKLVPLHIEHPQEQKIYRKRERMRLIYTPVGDSPADLSRLMELDMEIPHSFSESYLPTGAENGRIRSISQELSKREPRQLSQKYVQDPAPPVSLHAHSQQNLDVNITTGNIKAFGSLRDKGAVNMNISHAVQGRVEVPPKSSTERSAEHEEPSAEDDEEEFSPEEEDEERTAEEPKEHSAEPEERPVEREELRLESEEFSPEDEEGFVERSVVPELEVEVEEVMHHAPQSMQSVVERLSVFESALTELRSLVKTLKGGMSPSHKVLDSTVSSPRNGASMGPRTPSFLTEVAHT